MAEKQDGMGAVTHQMSAVDDDLHKSGHVKEANVASVALGMPPCIRENRSLKSEYPY